MMADLVHQHVAHDRSERLIVLGPIIEDRSAVQPDHIGHLHWCALAAEWQADALKQPEQVELGLGPHLVEYLLGRKVVDLNDQVRAQLAKLLRQLAKYLAGENFEFGERGRLYRAPVQRIDCEI